MPEPSDPIRTRFWPVRLPIRLLAVILLSRLFLFVLILRQPNFTLRTENNAPGYLQLATNIRLFHAYSFDLLASYSPLTTYPPLYAFFLALLTVFSYSSSVLLAVFAQCALGIIMSVYLWNWLTLIKDQRTATIRTDGRYGHQRIKLGTRVDGQTHLPVCAFDRAGVRRTPP